MAINFLDGITVDGDVGIGTTSPDSKLEVIGDYKQKALDGNSQGFTLSINSSTDAVSLNNYYNASMIFSTNNSAKMTILGSGNVGIGTTSPSEKLEVVGDIKVNDSVNPNIRFARGASYYWDIGHTSSDFQIKSQTGGTIMHLNYDGDVGIGTTAPTRKLVVRDGTGNAEIGFGNHPSATTEPCIMASDSSGNLDRIFQRQVSTNAVFIGDIDDNNGDVFLRAGGVTSMTIKDGGNVGIGTTSPLSIFQISDGNPDVYITSADTGQSDIFFGGSTTPTKGNIKYSDNADAMIFKVNTNTEALRIISSGNVGIGTTSPSTKLHVSGGDIRIDDTERIEFGSGGVRINNDAAGRMYNRAPLGFYWETNGGYRMVLDSSGRLGVGTTSPSHPLSVVSSYPQIKIQQTGQTPYFTFGSGTGFAVFDGVGTSGGLLDIRDDGSSRIRIDNSGNVGIGTTVPGQKFTVNGTIMSTGSSNPTLILQDTTHSDITIKGDSGIFSVTNASVGQNITMLYNGNVGIGTTAPTSKLHINGLLQAEGINSLYKGTLTLPASTGWYRAMEWTGSSRGGSVLVLSTTGGNFAPVSYIIKAYKTYGNPAGANTLKLEQYGISQYVSKARIVWDSGTSKAYVEVYRNDSSSNTMPMSVFQDKLIGYDATSTALFGTAVSGGGQVLEELPFTIEGTSVEKMTVSDSLAVGAITPSTTVGRIDASNDIVAYSTSDIRLKDNIKNIDKALDKVNSIQGIEFDWIEKEEVHGNSGHDIGVIAQEIEKILPDVVTTRENGYKAIKYEKIVPLLIEAIKDLSKQVDGLKRLI